MNARLLRVVAAVVAIGFLGSCGFPAEHRESEATLAQTGTSTEAESTTDESLESATITKSSVVAPGNGEADDDGVHPAIASLPFTDLDPLGGEALLVDGDVILRAVPMNDFPPSFIETDGSSILAGRFGDGGYPDSALIRINLEMGTVDRVVFPIGELPDPDPGAGWSVGTREQFEQFIKREFDDVFS